MKAFSWVFFRTNNSCLEANTINQSFCCPVSGFILKPLHICICAKAETNKLKGETWITSVVKSNVNVLSADSHLTFITA